ncbi:MAG: glycosyltransferase family 4 protein [Planctomycetes bacterium]|nr:glycosyltransferase family 4 protein [Planctomycetota bacterium]
MKIVHIITRMILGGAQENTLITCKLLAQRGHDVTLITGPAIGPEGELLSQTKGQKYKTIVVDKLVRAIDPIKDFASYYEIKRLLKEIAPDIVHTHSAKGGILGRFAASNLRPRPKIVHTIHGLAFHSYQSQLLNKFYIAIKKAAAKRTDFFISVSDAMAREAMSVGIGQKDKFVTAPSAVEKEIFLKPCSDEEKIEFRRKYDIPKDAVVLITIARLVKMKGHSYIVESAKKLSKRFDNVIWLFVGDGIDAGEIKKQIHDAGLAERFRFTGLVPPEEIPLAVGSSEILLHCSLREAFGRIFLQGMLCGKPVIAFNLDAAPEIINESTGRLVEPENIEHLIEACRELIEDEQLRNQLGENGREFAAEKFSPEAMVDTIEEVYRKVLEK